MKKIISLFARNHGDVSGAWHQRLVLRIRCYLIRRNIQRAMHHANIAEYRCDYLTPMDERGAFLCQDIAQAVARARDHFEQNAESSDA